MARLDRRVRLVDLVMGVAGMRISQAPDPAAVQRLRSRRDGGDTPLAPLVDRAGTLLFGRPDRRVRTEDREVPGPAGALRVRCYRPPRLADDAPLLVHLHGGGWVLGDLDGYAWVCSSLAAELGAVVASVEYRLAPEHPAPAAAEDAVAAARWLVEHADTVGATGPAAVIGDSAGGNLAALVAIDARDHSWGPLAAQVLLYPAVDLTMSFPSTRELADAPILRRADMDAFVAHYLGADGDPRDPSLSPWFVDDLSALAPALVQTAEHDPLRDEGRAYADRLAAAGVPTRWTEYAGMPHGYLSLPGACRSAPQALAEVVQYLRHHLGAVRADR